MEGQQERMEERREREGEEKVKGDKFPQFIIFYTSVIIIFIADRS